MDNLYLKAGIAGAFFALWPICMNRSGLNGPASALALVLGVTILLVPYVWYVGLGSMPVGWQWAAVVGACITCGIGNVLFGSALTKATPAELSSIFLMLVLAQIAVSAISNAVLTGTISVAKAVGLAAACVAAYLLK